jgi:hypothetical protein
MQVRRSLQPRSRCQHRNRRGQSNPALSLALSEGALRSQPSIRRENVRADAGAGHYGRIRPDGMSRPVASRKHDGIVHVYNPSRWLRGDVPMAACPRYCAAASQTCTLGSAFFGNAGHVRTEADSVCGHPKESLHVRYVPVQTSCPVAQRALTSVSPHKADGFAVDLLY